MLRSLNAAGKIIELRAYHTMYGIWKYFTADDGQICLAESDYLMIGTLEAYEQIRTYFGTEQSVSDLCGSGRRTVRLQRALDRERCTGSAQICGDVPQISGRRAGFFRGKSEKKQRSQSGFLNTDLDQVTQEIASYMK